MTERKVLFLDMDGTTLDDAHQTSPQNLHAIERMIKAGHEVVITTGRPMASAKYLLWNHGLDKVGCRYMIAFNGGMVLDTKSGKILYQRTVPLPWMKELIVKARRQGIYLQSYEGEIVLSEQECEHLDHYKNKTHMEVKVVPDLIEALHEEPCKALAIDIHSPEPLQAFAADTKEWAKGKLDMFLSCREYLEIVPTGVRKGDALRAFCERMGIPVQNSVAIGDEQNDITMLKAAGVGCAVANAIPEVKAVADYVTERDNNHSVLEEIEEKFMQ